MAPMDGDKSKDEQKQHQWQSGNELNAAGVCYGEVTAAAAKLI